jgi:hypothetical protein
MKNIQFLRETSLLNFPTIFCPPTQMLSGSPQATGIVVIGTLNDCSIIILKVLIWSIHDLLGLKLACSFQIPVSSMPDVLYSIWVKTLLISINNVIPRQLLQFL